MTNDIHRIVEHLFGKKRLDDVSQKDLEEFVAMHPYFAAGHFLLARKTQSSEPERTKKQTIKAALYYNNALWLQWLLNQELVPDAGKHPVRIEHSKDEIAPPVVDSPMAVESEEAVNGSQSLENRERKEEIDVALSSGQHIPETKDIDTVAADDIDFTGSNEAHEIVDTDQLTTAERHEENLPEEETAENIQHRNLVFSSPEENSFTTNESGTNTETTIPISLDPQIEREHDQDQSSEHGQEIAIENNLLEEHHQEEPVGEENDSVHGEQQSTEEAESRATAASIQRALNTTLIPTKAELEKSEFTFEPYHTIDYFASQGIRLQQSDLSKDQFGKQLKSFTEWLRSMKRLPQAAMETNLDEATQQSIQQIAEHSFEEKEIVTETMAEVWIKQGNKEKAIDTLLKLSLLNPSKSHYFAAKIEQLKAS